MKKLIFFLLFNMMVGSTFFAMQKGTQFSIEECKQVFRDHMQTVAKQSICLPTIGNKKYGDLIFMDTSKEYVGCIKRQCIKGCFRDDGSIVYIGCDREKKILEEKKEVPDKVVYAGWIVIQNHNISLQDWQAGELYRWLKLVRKYPL